MKKNYEVCPRCKTKERFGNPKCRNCGLVFDRLKNVTNKAGKKALKNKEYNKVLYMGKLPRDVSKIKLLILCIFLGWTGAHYCKVGRYKWFVFDLFALFFALVYAFIIIYILPELGMTRAEFDANYVGFFFSLMSLFFAISLIMWIGSIFQILTNTFKVPVAIDEEYFVEENLANEDVAKEILKEVETSHKEEQKLRQQAKKENKQKRKYFCPNCGQYVKIRKGENACPICDEPLK